MEFQINKIRNVKRSQNKGPRGVPTTKRLVRVVTCLLDARPSNNTEVMDRKLRIAKVFSSKIRFVGEKTRS